MNPRDMTDRHKHLITHAAAMGGWLSADYAQIDDYRGPMADLVTARVFEYIPSGPARHALTAAGRRLAEELS